MRRGKPQQEIYKPGSGKLRRSNQGADDTFADTSSVRSFDNNCISKEDSRDFNVEKHSHRKSKKPEQEFYVPRAVAEARGQQSSQSGTFDSGNINGSDNGQYIEKMNYSKRYSSNRNHGDSNAGRGNSQGDWKDKSPNRNYHRLGSEPRSGFDSNPSNWNRERDRYRERDTRSVEPTGPNNRNNNSDTGKIQAKPPSGRRHSTTGGNYHHFNTLMKMKNIEALAPRFKKKLLEDRGFTLEDIGWDGNSTTYQSQRQQNSGYHSLDVYETSTTYNPNINYHTLPGRPRGRGRFFHQDPEFQPGHNFRSLTPDRASIPRSPVNSRSGTPTRRFDNKPSSRPQTPLGRCEDSNKSSNENWGGRKGGKTSSFDRLGGRISESRHSNKERNNMFDKHRKDDDYYTKKERRNEEGKDKEKRDHSRRGEKKKRNDREKRSQSGDMVRHPSKESNISTESSSTLTEDITNAKEAISELTLSEITKVNEDEKIQIGPFINEEKDILDWNKEIELNDRLEADALSDAITRSSSMASLHDVSTRSVPSSNATAQTTKKKRRNSRRKSKQRSDSNYRDKTPVNRDRHDSHINSEYREKDNFKMPHEGGSNQHGRRRRRSSKDCRDSSFDRFHNRSRGPSRDVSFDRSGTSENWRDEIIRSRQNSEREGSVVHCGTKPNTERSRGNSERDELLTDTPTKKGGILVLPTPKSPDLTSSSSERPKFPDIRQPAAQQKTLFNPKNPNTPILVKSPGNRVSIPGFSDNYSEAPKLNKTDCSGKLVSVWYNESSDDFKSCHYPDLLRDIKRADVELQYIVNSGLLLVNYETVDNLRQFLKSALEFLLCKSIKFCQIANVEQHLWKILYYNIIEMTRKAIVDDPGNKQQYKGFLLFIIDEGTKYFERLVGVLEDTFQFAIADYTGNNSMAQPQGSKHTKLALISAQKIFMFLGDLGRYREQVNETSNYGKCRQWYVKSHEINPKNGKPYNQLAVLAVISRRKLDAVYYYMRSLMSSNPVPSAKEKLISLFDENRRKYEQGEKKRREERLERQRQHMKQKESEENGSSNFLRRETWIHPDCGTRLHRTTQALQDQDSEEEDLASLSSVDVNKRFITSYLHVHGKLITKIGMESFQDAAMQMLKEFRALLQHSPVSLPCNRFLQLLALNMFAIDSTQLKDLDLQQSCSYRSELQERALIVSLQMFNLILERCVSILQEHCNNFLDQNKSGSLLDCVPHDANVLLPAIKVWCDWMLCHNSIWNPPPSTHDFKVGPKGDLWSRLGLLMNILEQMVPDNDSTNEDFIDEPRDGYKEIRLPEDTTLCGFTPLILQDRKSVFASANLDPEAAQQKLRIMKLLFFGTGFLCGLEPPVLKLEIEDGRREYVSAVCSDQGQDSPADKAVLSRNDEVLLETFSEDEEESSKEIDLEASAEVKDLLHRKLELEKRNRNQQLHQQRVMKILSQSIVSVHLEIRPKYLVPDTNCFIDHLDSIHIVAKSHTYTLMVPIVVLSELEGLSKGNSSTTSRSPYTPSVEHVQKVAQAARSALEFLKKRHTSVKCVTSKGAVLPSTTFSTEDNTVWEVNMKNDDKILATCLVLCRNHCKDQTTEPLKDGEPRHLLRDVVLLTEDRNLRVKAHARDVPVRALPDFMHWAELGE
ncbi:hypothetical protein ABEB36_009872 [Hypothenemus hampei]|uniref:PIN domain-containing protein n=1 Tax=Hypothenemus hampei TaxID=57062 RepID=A0ABD1EHS0_HYPHA